MTLPVGDERNGASQGRDFESRDSEGRDSEGRDSEGRVSQGGASQASASGGLRCSHCGNRTRFDVFETVRRRRFAHFTLGGEMTVEEEEILAVEAQRIVCRWCDRDDTIERAGSPRADAADAGSAQEPQER